MKKFSVVFFVMTIFMCFTVNGEEPERKENLPIPRNLIPLEYTLLFKIDMADTTNLFTGVATIKIQCTKRTKEIILNAKNLEIDKNDVQITTGSSNSMTLDIEHQGPKEGEKYMIILKTELQEKEVVTVLIKYRKLSSLEHPDMAFIKHSYTKKPYDERKFFAVSRTGAIHARRLFPCIDEKDLRAPITVMISHHNKFRSLSNTNIEADAVSVSTQLTDFTVDKYKPTIPMSTFSIGLVVGNLKSNGVANAASGNEVRIWADESIIDQTTYARKIATTILEFYQGYFHCSKVVRKIDIVALPNYGNTDKWMLDLITLDESAIVSQNSFQEHRRIELTFQLCDAFSHQYFGPGTTMSKWRGNWLNMGLALFFRYYGFQLFYRKGVGIFRYIQRTESFIRLSDVDPKRIFHPLTLSDSQINLNTLFEDSAFADIAYCLVRMLNSIVGETNNVLLEGVRKYIAESRDKVFNLNQIWPLFSRETYSMPRHTSLQQVMDSWTSTNAIPVIKLSRDDGTEMVSVTQEPLESDSEGNKIYKHVLLSYATKSDLLNGNHKQSERIWVKQKTEKIIQVSIKEWIIHDSRLDVLCRCVYDQSILKLIEETLSDESQYTIIPDLARTQLISDMFAIVEIEEYPDYTYSMVFRILKYLKYEGSTPPLMVALHEFNKIRLRLLGSKAFSLFQDYVQQIVQKIIDRENYNMDVTDQFSFDNYNMYTWKKTIIATACTFQVKSCVEHSTAAFSKWQNDGYEKPEEHNPFPEIIRQYIYCQTIRTGGEQEWNFLWKLYDKKNAKKSDDILNALACTVDVKQLKEYLKWSIDTDKIALEDSLTVFKSVGTNVGGYNLMYEFLYDNSEYILAKNDDNLPHVYTSLKILYEITMNQEDFDKLEAFKNSIASRVENIETHLEESRKKAQKNILWLKNNGEDISSFLKS